MDNNINYIAFDFVEGNNNEISPENVEVEITVLDQYKVAEYKFNNTLADLIPEFNEGFTYNYEDIDDYIEKMNPIMTSGSLTGQNGEEFIDDNYPNANRSDFISIYPSMQYYHVSDSQQINYFWYDENKSFIKVDYNINPNEVITSPENALYLRITKGDWVDTILHSVITTRTIYSDSLPTKISFEGGLALLELGFLEIGGLTSLRRMFYGCTNVTYINTENWNTSNVTNMASMFQYCYKLNTLDVSNWDTSNVTDFSGFLSGYDTKMTISEIRGIEKINTSKATNLQDMFYNCCYLTSLDVSEWDTSNVTKMSGLFRYCSSLTELNVTNFNTSKIDSIHSIFYDCKLITSLDLSNWDVSNVTNANYTFNGCTNLTTLNLNNWDLNSVTSNNNTFNTCSNLTHIEMNNSNYNSVNKVIAQLPTRTSDSISTLRIVGIDDASQVDISTASSKYWITRTELFKLNDKAVDALYIEDKRVMQIYLNGKPLL